MAEERTARRAPALAYPAGTAEARGLDPASYRDPEIFARERARIFSREWLCIGRVEDVARPGDYASVDIAGEPLVMVRDRDGALHVHSRVCRHRSMILVEGSGNAGNFVCPYHAWTYALDGRLVGAPEMDRSPGFARERCRLPGPRVEIWLGFVFVNFDPEASPLAPRLAPLSGALANWSLADMVTVRSFEFELGWNWKVMCENFIEAYHHLGAHRLSLEPFLPTRLVQVEESKGPYAIVHMGHAKPVGHVPEEARAPTALPDIAALTAGQRGRSSLVHVFPCHLISPEADRMEYYTVFPLAPDRLRVRKHFCVPRAALAEPRTDAAIGELAARHLAYRIEDVAINDGVMKGSGSRYAARGHLSHLERPLWDFRRWWDERMAD